MTAPRPEAVELAERIARGRVYVPISSVAWLASLIDAAITAAEERAREEQREKDCKAVCLYCSRGEPFNADGKHMVVPKHWTKATPRRCDARAIREGR